MLGSLLVDGEAIHEIRGELQSSHFFNPVNQWIYDACLALTERGEAIDQIYITGGSSRVPNLVESLGERFGIPVDRLDPFQRVTLNKDIAPEMAEELSSCAAIV